MNMRLITTGIVLCMISLTSCTADKKERNDSEKAKPNKSEKAPNIDAIQFSYRDISTKEFMEYIHDPKAIVIDVRTPEEYEKGSIANAKNINIRSDDFVNDVSSKAEKNKSLYVFCQSGGRSAKACKLLIDAGYQNVYNLNGGYAALVSEKK